MIPRLGTVQLALGLALAAPIPARAQVSSPEPALVELQLGRLVARTVRAFRVGDEALVPLSSFLELAELRITRPGGDTLATLLQPGNLPLVVDPASRTLVVGKERRQLQPTEMIAAEGEVYLATAVLGRILKLEWVVSWPDLQVAVLDPERLPIALRVRREAFLSSRMAQSQTSTSTGLELALERPRLDGVVLDYSVLTPTASPVDGGAYSTTLGLDVFGGSFGFGLRSQEGAGQAPRADVSWTGIWRKNRWLSQVQLGDGLSSGPRVRTLRGVSISNSPYARPEVLGNVPFGGQLGPGWTVEAYRGGRLVGFDSVNALGEFSFDLPVQYGENPVDFVAYGPFGEVREFNRAYRVRTEGLQARRFEYGLSAGQCRTDRCSASGNLDLRYGVSTRWTVRAGLDQFWRDSLGSLTHPYVGVLGNIGNAVSVEAEAVGDAVLRGAARLEPSVNLQLQLEATRFARGLRDPILTPAGRLSQWTLTGFLRPVTRWGATYFDASLDRIQTSDATITSSRLGGSFQLAEIRVLPSVRFQRSDGLAPDSRTFYGFNTVVLPHPGLGKVLGSLTARTSFELEAGHGASSASAYVGLPILRGLRSETGVSWLSGSSGPMLTFLLAAEFPSVRSYSTVTGGGGVPTGGSQYVQGSAIYNPARGSVDFAAGPALQRGGVTGRVFLDRNGNGRYDAGEPPVPDVRVVVGPTFAFSDSSGAYHVWDLLPFDPTLVRVDSTSLPSPLWVPGFAAARVEPSPNRYRRLDVPVLPGGVIEGMLRYADGRSDGTVAGIALVLTHRQSGERRVITTFSDGGFYAIGIRPGQWELTVDPRCLDLLRTTAAAVRFQLAASEEGASVDGLEVLLK